MRAALFGLVSGANIWAVVGTFQLVRDTTFHGVKRADLLELARIEPFLRNRPRKKSA